MPDSALFLSVIGNATAFCYRVQASPKKMPEGRMPTRGDLRAETILVEEEYGRNQIFTLLKFIFYLKI